jgi:hypothetical protein
MTVCVQRSLKDPLFSMASTEVLEHTVNDMHTELCEMPFSESEHFARKHTTLWAHN